MGNKYKRDKRPAGHQQAGPSAKKGRPNPPKKIAVQGPADPALTAYASRCFSY